MSMIPLISIVGRPNVGKSTLFNRLTRTRDALVDPMPGLTRDIKIRPITVKGKSVNIADTGGIEDYGDEPGELVGLVTEKTLDIIKKSHIILAIFDIKTGLIPQDREIVKLLRDIDKPTIFIANKADTDRDELLIGELYETGAEEIVPISAEHGRGIGKLIDIIDDNLEKLSLSPSCDMESSSIDEPIRVAIIGRPNVGKSSLFNALVGEDRVIVSHVAGTTRDAIDTLIERHNAPPIILVDTAGIRRKSRTKKRVEKFSVLKALDAIKRSHICLIVIDAIEGITDQDKRLIGYAEEYGRACITIYNKWDMVDERLSRLRIEELKLAKKFISYAPHINCSAKTKMRVGSIFPLVERVFKDFSASVSTGSLNRILKDALLKRTPPISKGHQIKMYYTTQVATCPPTFLIFANYPDKVPEYYKRFLINYLRNALSIKLSPVKIILRKRERREK